jgi:hypothetical protein
MCDYSLHCIASRSAKAADALVTTSFPGTRTRGFASVDEPGVAVCLLPGTELAFENDVTWRRPFFGLFQKMRSCGRLARFRQVNREPGDTHHDAIEFPNGEIVLVTDLRPGQRATVLQLPVAAQLDRASRPMRGGVTVIDAAPLPVRAHQPDHA